MEHSTVDGERAWLAASSTPRSMIAFWSERSPTREAKLASLASDFEFRSADSRGQDLRCLIEIPFLEDQYVDKTVRQLVAQIGPAVDQPTEASANRGSFLAVRRTS